MDTARALVLLEGMLDEIPRLKRLDHKNQEFASWDQRVREILRTAFGSNSNEYARYNGILLLKRVQTEEDRQQAYVDHVTQREDALKSILQKHKVVGDREGVNMVDKEELLAELVRFHDGLVRYKRLVLAGKDGSLTSEEEKEFQSLSVELQREYGSQKAIIEECGGPTFVALEGGKHQYEAFTSTFAYTQFSSEAFVLVMDSAVAAVNRAIWYLKSPTLSCTKAQDVIIISPPKAFIAHSSETPALSKLKAFLNALGVIPVIAEEQPSEDRSIDKQVDWCLDQSNCAIVLATKGDIDGHTGEFLPRGNILIEIGRCQERFLGRIVYLIETGTKFPSNISEKVRARFSPQSMDKAFTKVAKELVAFGLIRATKG